MPRSYGRWHWSGAGMEANIDAVQPSLLLRLKEAPQGVHGSEKRVVLCVKAITEYGLRQQWRESTHLLAARTLSSIAKNSRSRSQRQFLCAEVTNEESVAPDLQLPGGRTRLSVPALDRGLTARLYKKAANACREAGQWEACVHMLRNLGQLRQAGDGQGLRQVPSRKVGLDLSP